MNKICGRGMNVSIEVARDHTIPVRRQASINPLSLDYGRTATRCKRRHGRSRFVSRGQAETSVDRPLRPDAHSWRRSKRTSTNLVGCSTDLGCEPVLFPEVLLAHPFGRKMPPINSSTIAIPKRILRCRGSSIRSGSALQGSWSKYTYHLSR